jgi:hypothetical protein
MRYRRWSSLLLLPLPWGWAFVIFFLSEKGLAFFATLRLLILREELGLVPFLGLQKPGVFFPICTSMPLLPGSEIFLVWETAKHASRFARIHRAGSCLRHRPVRGGDCQRLRQRRAQLRAKCESAPLRRSVTERATRSTPNAFGVNGIVKKVKRVLKSLTRRHRFQHCKSSRAHFFPFAPQNGVQLTAQQQ